MISAVKRSKQKIGGSEPSLASGPRPATEEDVWKGEGQGRGEESFLSHGAAGNWRPVPVELE